MSRKERHYSATALQAAELLGHQVRQGRIDRRWTVRELAERAGISTNTLTRLEKGDPGVSIGVAFDTATLVGVPLFDAEPNRLAAENSRSREKTKLLPQRVRRGADGFHDDF
jgi:transcriptional regulator with XRE-family HTH domain